MSQLKHPEKAVLVTVNHELEALKVLLNETGISKVQLHGSEDDNYCETLQHQGIYVIKAINIDQQLPAALLISYKHVDAFLFDTKGKLPGGNGISFNWNVLSEYQMKQPFLLSGGLQLSLLEELKQFKHSKLMAYDINSGFETSPTVKNIEEIRTFYKAIQA